MRELEKPLAAVKGRWMTGLTGAEAAPASWRAVLGEGPEAELRLLALVGQVGEIGWRAPVPELEQTPPLPSLALPVLPQAARTRFRQILAQEKPSALVLAPVLHLMAARGYVVHPADWMPPASDSHAPPVYDPWIDWLNNRTQGIAHEVLSEENWEDWFPSERRQALAALGRTDRPAMRALLAARAGSVPAEERLRLVGLLAEGLCAEDAPFLESLGKDRSGKVKALAAQFLYRLGIGESDGDLVAELADMLEMARGRMLSLAKGLGPKKLKNNAQVNRRNELFGLVPLHGIAAAFDLTPEEAVVGWRMSADKRTNASKMTTFAFATMVADTGPDAVQMPLAERLIAEGHPDEVMPLLPRLSETDRAMLAKKALAAEGDRFRLACEVYTPRLGTVSGEDILKTRDFRTLETDLAALHAEEEKQLAALQKGIAIERQRQSWQAEARVNDVMRRLGLLVNHDTAKRLVAHFTNMGLMPVDPRLSLLHLNIALPPRSPE